jgi:hypothetical protein
MYLGGFMRLHTRLATLASIPALALGLGLATATAGSAAANNISFSSTAGNSAHWNADHTALVFTVTNGTANAHQGLGGYALAYLHHTPSQLPTTEPSFSGDNIASGTPRLDIFMADGSYFFVYNDGSFQYINAGPLSQDCWGGSACQAGWATLAGAVNTSVSSVYVIADGSQTMPYTATVNSLVYSGITYVP